MGFRRYMLQRLLRLMLTIAGVTMITFAMMALVPGDPAEIIAGYGKESEPSAAEIAAVRERYGFDLPLHVRYIDWLGRALHGDLGQSLRTGRPVWQEIAVRLPATLGLTLASLAVALAIAVPVGILSSVRRHTPLDGLVRLVALLAASVPSFWLGAMLILLFAVYLGWLPSMGRGGPAHWILPAVTLGVGASAQLLRLIRAHLSETLLQDFVRTARAKGLPERIIVLRHALKPALLPVITALGLQLGSLLGGAVIIETIFAWPGLGMLIIESILARDLAVIQGFALIMGLVFTITNCLVDIGYTWLDPRIQPVG